MPAATLRKPSSSIVTIPRARAAAWISVSLGCSHTTEATIASAGGSNAGPLAAVRVGGEIRKEEGFVLLVVLMVLAILSAIAGSLATASRVELETIHGLREHVLADLAADAGLVLAGHLLTNPPLHDFRQPSQFGPWEGACRFGSVILRIRIADESGKIDVNAGSRVLLAQLLVGLGQSRSEAARIVQAIDDYVDRDDMLRGTGGSEQEAYAQAAYPLPRNDRLVSLDELDQVLGFASSPDGAHRLIDRVRP